MKSEVPRFRNKFENTLSAKRSCQDRYKIFRFLHKSLIAEELYFDSETLVKQQEIVSFKSPPLRFQAKTAFKCPAWIWFFTEGCFMWSTNIEEYGKVTS